jgi:hypothetical protein
MKLRFTRRFNLTSDDYDELFWRVQAMRVQLHKYIHRRAEKCIVLKESGVS